MVAGIIAVRRGQFASAHAHLDEARAPREGGTDADVTGAIATAMAELAIGEGLLEEARRLVEHSLDALGERDAQHHLLQLVALGLRVEADARGRRSGRNADSTVRNGADLIGRMQSMESGRRLPLTRQGVALTALCEAEAARGRGEPDPKLWARVAEAWAALSHPYETTYARWRQSEAFLGRDAKQTWVARQSCQEARRAQTRAGRRKPSGTRSHRADAHHPGLCTIHRAGSERCASCSASRNNSRRVT